MNIGQRVILSHLLYEENFPGVIIALDLFQENLCTVKLDCQERPVHGVLFYEDAPDVVYSSLWQICWPESKTPIEGSQP